MLKLATKFLPWQPAYELAHQAGFHCAELWLDAEVLASWEKAAQQARHYPLEYALHFPNKGQLSGETLQQCVELYRALGCRALVIHQPMFDRYAEELLKRGPELRLGIENHRLNPAEFERWAEQSPGLTLDVEHLWMMTLQNAPLPTLLETVRHFLQRFGSKLRHVHLPGYLPGQKEHRPMYCSRDMIFGVLSLFAEAGFEGLIVSEVNEPFQNPNDLRMDVLLFDTWRAQHDPLSKLAAK